MTKKTPLFATLALLASACLWRAEAASVTWWLSMPIHAPVGETLYADSLTVYLLDVASQTSSSMVYLYDLASGRQIATAEVLQAIYGTGAAYKADVSVTEIASTGLGNVTFDVSGTAPSVEDAAILFVFDNSAHAGKTYFNFSDEGALESQQTIFGPVTKNTFTVEAGEAQGADGSRLRLSGATGWIMSAIPEPSSGLLMLLGAGLMALRRRV